MWLPTNTTALLMPRARRRVVAGPAKDTAGPLRLPLHRPTIITLMLIRILILGVLVSGCGTGRVSFTAVDLTAGASGTAASRDQSSKLSAKPNASAPAMLVPAKFTRSFVTRPRR